jgi:hypothetical protein
MRRAAPASLGKAQVKATTEEIESSIISQFLSEREKETREKAEFLSGFAS